LVIIVIRENLMRGSRRGGREREREREMRDVSSPLLPKRKQQGERG